ncbi:MAG: hypothetical protein HC856_05160, partial [Pseudanabaena sp. RU_4_16]|nr:hypothetical protein [Pseudanabaena sp. RU_4_16]
MGILTAYRDRSYEDLGYAAGSNMAASATNPAIIINPAGINFLVLTNRTI